LSAATLATGPGPGNLLSIAWYGFCAATNPNNGQNANQRPRIQTVIPDNGKGASTQIINGPLGNPEPGLKPTYGAEPNNHL